MTYWKSSKSIYDQMEAERKITKIYRNTRPYKDVIRPTTIVTPGGQIINLDKRLPTQRYTQSGPPKVVNIQLGQGKGDYNKGGPGHPGIIEGEYKHISDGPGRAQGSRSAFIMGQIARRVARLHPAMRAADVGLMAYDIWQYLVLRKQFPQPGGTGPAPGGTQICNDGGPGGHFVIRGRTGNPTFCDLSWGSWGSEWGRPTEADARRYGFGVQEWTPAVNIPGYGDPARAWDYAPGYTGPWPPFVDMPSPEVFVPLLSQPLPHNATDAGSGYKPPPPPVPQKLRSRPPGPREKERKGEMPPWALKVMEGAWAATEAIDALDAIWKALPKDIRDATPKTGRTRKGALIGEGKAYSTPLDKAKHLYDNLDKLDLPEAIKNLIINHYTDALMGRFHGTVDKARRRAGGTGWGAAWT